LLLWHPRFEIFFALRRLPLGAAFVPHASVLAQTDPLPSWNDGPAKKSITDFVSRITAQGGADFAYDRQAKVGKLDSALDEATAKGWTVADLKKDWNAVFPGEK
jgi:hypothetical protein